MIDIIMLSTLLAGPQHGYALKKSASLILNQPELHNNTVYPLLERFIGQGWVRKKNDAGERGQTRHVYSLTPAGRSEVIARLSEFNEKQASSDAEFRLRVGLFGLLTSQARRRILEARALALERRDQHLSSLQQSFPLTGFNAEAVRFSREQITNELRWIRKLSRMHPRA